MMKKKIISIQTYLFVIGLFFATSIILNLIFSDPEFSNPYDEIEFAQKTADPSRAETVYLNLLKSDSLNIDLNYGYVVNHFDIPEQEKTDRYSYTYRDDAPLFSKYRAMHASIDTNISDVGNYMLGLIYLCYNNVYEAKSNLLNVRNKRLKFLNNSLGNIYRKSNPDSAISFYKKEIELRGNLEGAISNLANLAIEQKMLVLLDSLNQDTELNHFLSLSQKREYFFLKLNFTNYLKTLVSKLVKSIDGFGFLGALLITIIWLFYFRWLDIFEREKWYHIAIVFILSCLFAYSSFFFYDLLNLTFHFNTNGFWLNDLFYCIFGIGFVEELVKMLPFLLFINFSDAANEPIDYIIYASVSAIGFAFIENLLYFQNGTYHIMHGRALASVVAHMACSSIMAYGVIIHKYKSKKPLLLTLSFTFLMAATVHGLYDFWLINYTVHSFSFVTFFILLGSVLIWNSLKNNALNNSPFYDQNRKLEIEKISKHLFILLSCVFLFEYFAITINYGPTVGNRLFLKSVASGIFLLVFLTGKLGHFEIKPGVWRNIWNWRNSLNSR